MTDAPEGPKATTSEDPIEEEFFSEPRIRLDGPDDDTDPRGQAAREAIERAFVRARRARLARYVLGATCAAHVLCAAALARTLTGEMPWPPAPASGSASASAFASPSVPASAELALAAWSTPPEVAVQARQALATARDALARDDHEAAITAAARSIALDPSPGAAWVLLGDSYDRAGRPDEARKAYRACLDEARSETDQCMAHLR